MKTQHVKPPCCRGAIRKFGKRRRQCNTCFRTWRIRKKKRGRKRLRVDTPLAQRYVTGEFSSLASLARRKKKNREWIRRRFARSLEYHMEKARWEFPGGTESLILIADAMWQTIAGIECVVYIRLLRPINASRAWIMEPLVVPGKESMAGWEIVLDEIPPSVKRRIGALVCDGEPHLVYLAKQQGLLVQRCHFHLLASIKNYVSAGPLSRNREFGRAVLETVRAFLITEDKNARFQLLDAVRRLRLQAKNRKLRSRLSGLIKHADDFLAYMQYPGLCLPATTNAAESLIRGIRDMLYRARGFKSVVSFSRWVKMFCLEKKTVACNGKFQPNKRV